VVEALGESQVQGAAFRGEVYGNGACGLEQGERQEILAAQDGRLRIEGIDGAAPLVGEGGGEFPGRDGTHLAQDAAEFFSLRERLRVERFAKLLLRDGTLVDEQQAERKTMTARTITHGAGEEAADLGQQMGLQAVGGAEPAAIEVHTSDLQ